MKPASSISCSLSYFVEHFEGQLVPNGYAKREDRYYKIVTLTEKNVKLVPIEYLNEDS